MLKGSKGECKIARFILLDSSISSATAKHLCPAPNSHDNVFPSSVMLGCRAPPNPDCRFCLERHWTRLPQSLLSSNHERYPRSVRHVRDAVHDGRPGRAAAQGAKPSRLRQAHSRPIAIPPPCRHVRPRSAGPSSDRQRQDSGLLPSIVAQDSVTQVW